MKTILIVDDELQILKSFRRLFLGREYDLICMQSGEAALEALADNPVHMIITDMQMPDMNGYELLSVVKEKYPGVFRIILSGNTDEQQILKAIHKGIANLYIMKPWNNKEIIRMLDQVFETETLLQDRKLLEEFNNLSELPTLKSSYQRIIEMTESDADLADITAAIELDQSIASKILRIANSAYFGVKTGSVRQAVLFLGFNNIRNVIISTTFFDFMMIPPDSKRFAQSLQEHAFLTNKLMHMIYKQHLHKEVPEQASAAGLLHNIGMLYMLGRFGGRFSTVIRECIAQGTDLLAREREEFPVSHTEAGGFLLRWWEIPYPIVEAALYCFNPLSESIINSELVCAVHIARYFACELLHIHFPCAVYEEAFQKLGLEKEEIENSIKKISGFKKNTAVY